MGSTDTLAGNLGVKGVFPGEEPLTLETRAFVRRGDVEGRARAVTANGDDHRDPQGRWLSRVTVERPKGRRVADLRIVVPYTSLKPAPGRDELAYEVRGLRDGDVDLARATPKMPRFVSTRIRTKISQLLEVDATHSEKEICTASLLKG